MRENKCSNFIVNRETTLGAHQNYVHIKIDTNYFSLKKILVGLEKYYIFQAKTSFFTWSHPARFDLGNETSLFISLPHAVSNSAS